MALPIVVLCIFSLFTMSVKAEYMCGDLTSDGYGNICNDSGQPVGTVSNEGCPGYNNPCGDPIYPPAGAIPPNADEFLSDSPTATTSSKKRNNPAPLGACWKDNPKARIAPISWYWPVYKNVHLQVYDSTGAWWFNGWIKSNSYTVFSKDGKGQFPGVPTDGRTIYAQVSYGDGFSPLGTINCR